MYKTLLHFNVQQCPSEIKIIQFFNSIKKNKYWGINITRKVKDLYIEDYKTERNWRPQYIEKHIISMEELILLSLYYPQNICRFNILLIKIPDIFHRNRKKKP